MSIVALDAPDFRTVSVPQAAPEGSWRSVQADFAAVREGGLGQARACRAGWNQDQSQCVEAQGDELRAHGKARNGAASRGGHMVRRGRGGGRRGGPAAGPSSTTTARSTPRSVSLIGLAGLKARRFEAESFAARGAHRNEEPERKYLPCRRVGHVQDGQGEIVAERLKHTEPPATPKEARFEKRGTKARRHCEYRQRLAIGTQPVAGQHPPDHQPEKYCGQYILLGVCPSR